MDLLAFTGHLGIAETEHIGKIKERHLRSFTLIAKTQAGRRSDPPVFRGDRHKDVAGRHPPHETPIPGTPSIRSHVALLARRRQIREQIIQPKNTDIIRSERHRLRTNGQKPLR